MVNKYQDKEIDRYEDDLNYFMVGNPKNLDQLEKDWEDFNSMPVDQRRMSDNKSIELFGYTNQQRYDAMKSKMLRHDDFDITDISFEEEVDSQKVNLNDIHYEKEAIDAAEEWAVTAMRVIITPKRTLEDLEDTWVKWKDQIRKHQRESDWKSMELFGVDNATHYEYLKSHYIKKDVEDPESLNPIDDNIGTTMTESSIVKSDNTIKESHVEKLCREVRTNRKDILDYCLELAKLKKTATIYESELISSTIDNSIEYYKDNVAGVFDKDELPSDVPFYDADEMIDLGIFDKDTNKYMIEPDNDMLDPDVTVKEWYDDYRLLSMGVKTENTSKYSILRVNKLRELYRDFNSIRESNDIDRINARKQSILELGWNPEFDFTPENRVLARERLITRLTEQYSQYKFVDLSEVYFNNEEAALKLDIREELYPVFIVLVQGKSIFSKTIQKVTNSSFSHAAIGLDPSLEKLYSFNIQGANGLSFESVKRYSKDAKLGVFSIFVKGRELENIKNNLDYYIENKDKTKYSFLNVLTIPFQVDVEFNFRMICSQFVDRILKLADIDLTGKKSATVYPADFKSSAGRNNKIYTIYEGKVQNYKYKRTETLLTTLRGKAKYINEFAMNIIDESTYIDSLIENVHDLNRLMILDEKSHLLSEDTKKIYDAMIKPYIVSIYEAKEFPIQFDEDGALLIKNIQSLDFEAEYSKSHKLLMAYEKSSNTEGMKYELSKLWFLNHVIEKRVHNSKTSKEDKEKLHKARAKILNDFNKYLAIVMDKEPDFNFSVYYEDSPFSDAAYKFRPSTLKYGGKILKSIILK